MYTLQQIGIFKITMFNSIYSGLRYQETEEKIQHILTGRHDYIIYFIGKR